MKYTYKESSDILREQYQSKNHDYGNSASLTYKKFGDVAYAVRLSDKLNRWQRLLKSESQVKDESLKDTVGDACTYCCMWLSDIYNEPVESMFRAVALSTLTHKLDYAIQPKPEYDFSYDALVKLAEFDFIGQPNQEDAILHLASIALDAYTNMLNKENDNVEKTT